MAWRLVPLGKETSLLNWKTGMRQADTVYLGILREIELCMARDLHLNRAPLNVTQSFLVGLYRKVEERRHLTTLQEVSTTKADVITNKDINRS